MAASLPSGILHLWAYVWNSLGAAAAWFGRTEPAGLPRWLWAGLIVLAAYVVGHIGGRVLVGLLRLALLAAAVLIGWDLLHAVG